MKHPIGIFNRLLGLMGVGLFTNGYDHDVRKVEGWNLGHGSIVGFHPTNQLARFSPLNMPSIVKSKSI